MTSPISITPSKSLILAIGMAGALLYACGGSAPSPATETKRLESVNRTVPAQAPEKGGSTLQFHFANQKSEARMELDLNSTDVYVDMTGARNMDSSSQATVKSKPENPEMPPEAGAENTEDITGKVLSGIRRAQELFYHKQYDEALAVVKQSLEAHPTAEGYALAGSIYYMQGQKKAARKQWQEALRLNPDMPSIVNMLKKTSGQADTKTAVPDSGKTKPVPGGTQP